MNKRNCRSTTKFLKMTFDALGRSSGDIQGNEQKSRNVMEEPRS